MTKVAVIGAGAWGTALAAQAARREHEVTIWAREPEVTRDINTLHENRTFLADVPLPPSLRATGDPQEALASAELVILVPPSAFLRQVVTSIASLLPQDAPLVVATKGIESESLLLMLDVVAEVVPSAKLAVLSGPSFAKEVGLGLPTDVVVAAKDETLAIGIADKMHSPTFRTYTNHDPIGVEVGGAMKNVLAIAAGACDGLGLGMNARAALITRGLAEMARLAVALGGDPLTLMGLSGMGDLILTATGALSRNRTLGEKLAEGADPATYLKSQKTVAEGYLTAKAAHALGQKLNVDMPITEQVYTVLHEGRPLKEAIMRLLDRAQKHELWGFGVPTR